MSVVRRTAITGAPGAGKSSLLDELSRRGIETVAEVARTILKQDGGMALREAEPAGFAEAMLEAQLLAWDTHPTVQPVVFDRGFPDIVGFLRVEGLSVSAAVDRVCRTYRFDGPIFRAFPWREIYVRDEERVQGWSEAVASDKAVVGAWADYGYELIDLPKASIAERADFVCQQL